MDDRKIPDLFVERQLLPNKWLYTTPETEYNINGEIFWLQKHYNDDNFKFEVVSDTDSFDESGSDTLDEKESGFLSVSIEKTRHGYIVNSTILLSVTNWNTILLLEEDIWCCVCVDIITDPARHIESEIHLKSMNKYQPLEQFHLSIVRLIKDHYHCGVCNESFHISHNKHFDCETHENNQLYAINHCSDYQNVYSNYDKLISSRPESVCGTSESGIAVSNESDVYLNKTVENPCGYTSVDTVPKQFFINWFDEKYKIDKDAWNMIIDINQKIYCMACKKTYDIHEKVKHCTSDGHIGNLKSCEPVDMYKDLIIRKIDEKFYHCATCNNLQVENTLAHHISVVHKTSKLFGNETEESRIAKASTKSCEIGISKTSQNNDNVALNSLNVMDGQEHANTKGHVINGQDLKQRGITIKQFGCNITLSLLSYNLVMISLIDFYCHLCNVTLKEVDVLNHLNERSHTFLMQLTFIKEFGVNLIRRINTRIDNGRVVRMNGGLHCALCHYTMNNTILDINTHITTPFHVYNLNKALCSYQTETSHGQNETLHSQNVITNGQNETSNGQKVRVKSEQQKIEDVEIKASKDERKKRVTSAVDSRKMCVKVENVSNENVKNTREAKPETKMEISGSDENKTVLKDPIQVIFNDIYKVSVESDPKIEHRERLYEMFVESVVVVKLKNKCVRISFASYNTFVSVGNGCWYCAVCSTQKSVLDNHFLMESHLMNLKRFPFIDKYASHLIRQNKQLYHCGICNVIINRTDIQTHITWSDHLSLCAVKHPLKDLKKMHIIKVSTAKEVQFDESALVTKVLANYKYDVGNTPSVAKRNKFITHNNTVFKLTWDAWQGVLRSKSGYQCLMCSCSMKTYELSGHVNSDRHSKQLYTFDVQHLPALMRKINDSIFHCLTCNSEVPMEQLKDHIKSKKHMKSHKDIMNVTETNLDDQDVLNL